LGHTDPPRFLLHHAPRSRSGRILWLLEEAGAPHDLVWHALQDGTQKRPEYLSVNPLGKVPALEDRGPRGDWDGVAVTESAAICAYVADALPEAGLAPEIGSPSRAAYASWLAYAPGVLEPAVADRIFPRAQEPRSSAIGWPPFEEAVARVETALDDRAFLLGDRFSAADVMVGGLLGWFIQWGLMQPGPNLARYLASLEARPARQRALGRDAAPI
jgi:glutathione S-transferase